MSSSVRIGVVGTSGWADFMYLSSLKSHPQADVVAICGRNRERAAELAAKYNIPGVFTDYREMIGQANLDAIIIGAPDDLHYEIAMASIKAGLHILCDKPLAVTAGQAREMAEMAEAAGVKHMVLFTYRWMPFFRYVRELLDQGCVGRVYHCEFRYVMGYARKQAYEWRLDQKRANGVLADLGSHMIDLAHWLVGDISRVSAQLGVFVERPGAAGEKLDPANDSASLLLEFANGAQGTMHVSVVTHMADRYMQQQVKLYGDAGSLELDMPYNGSEAGPTIRVARNQDEKFETMPIPDDYWGGASPTESFGVFSRQPVGCREFVDAILSDRPVSPTFVDGYKTQQVIEAALLSHKSRAWVEVSIQGQ